MATALQDLKTRLTRINDLNAAAALLDWDQATYMPPGGAEARARQLATLSELAHTQMTDPGLGELLQSLSGSNLSPDDRTLVQVSQRDFQRAVQVPPAFMAEFRRHQAACYVAWTQAKPHNDFAAVCPHMEKTLDYSRQLASFFSGYESIADPLIEYLDPGMTAASIRSVFAELRRELVPIVQAVTAQPPADDSCLLQDFPEDQQLAFAMEISKAFGYDLNRGRQDMTHHPFMTKFSLGDVRITARAQRHDLGDALFSIWHETGHALYEQGIRLDFEGTPLADGISAGVHESQSRLWENLVGRSRDFWMCFYPRLQAVFPQQLGAVTLDTFYRAINKVQRSFIRTDADELTYNLHVMLRFELELDLLEGRLAVKDLPAAWNERFQADFGLTPPTDTLGCLQDVHWYGGQIGGVFQGYTLGNLMSAQFFEAALQAHPEIPAQIQTGQFETLHSWLRNNLYQHGRQYTPTEALQQATGSGLTIAPYLRYIRRKYGELYQL